MKKILILVRHAKASRDPLRWPDDRERPLNERGQRDAQRMGRRLARRGIRPDLLLSSPALRSLSTAQLMATALDCPRRRLVVDERLYGCDPAQLLALVRALDPGLRRVMLFGHNPEFSLFARALSDELEPELPTCAVAEFHFADTDWADVGRLAPESVRLELPWR